MTTSPHDYSDLELTVGDRLRRARERRTGLDQVEFAELISVSRGTVSNYERDQIPHGPRRTLVLRAWAMATGVSVGWLETGRESAPTPPPAGHSDDLDALTRSKARRAGATRDIRNTQRYPALVRAA